MEMVLLQTLVVVIETGSFTAAAERLCVTQSAVSRRIRQLEEHFGIPLLDRGCEGATPTQAGQTLVGKARRILQLEQEMEVAVGGLRKQHRLKFCCTPCFGACRLPAVFEHFSGRYGLNCGLDIAFLVPWGIVDGLLSGRYDLAVVEHCGDLDQAACSVYPLPDDDMVFISAPQLGIVDAEATAKQLASQRLFFKTRNGCAYRFLRDRLHKIGHDVAEFGNITYYDDLLGIVRQVVEGLGIGFVSRDLVAKEIEAGLLRVHRVAQFDHVRLRSLMISPQFQLTDIARHFIEMIFVNFGEDLPAGLR